MLYWLDTEFIEDGRTIDLLSIGIVAEDGREFYEQSAECNIANGNDWVQAHVIPHLHRCPTNTVAHPPLKCNALCPWASREWIARNLQHFCDPAEHGKPEFWGYFADYDWVALCQLFGRMVDLPKGWPMYCRDIKQWCDDLGNPRLPEQGKGEHHALADAKWNRMAWLFLAGLAEDRR